LNCYYSALEQESLLHITGPDTLTFLQGQTTCDTRIVDADHGVPGAYCTPQGRVVCDFLLTRLGPEHFALRMRRDIRAASKAIFGKYIIFSKAELDDEREDWQPFGFWGAEAASVLADMFGTVPGERFGCRSAEDFVLVQMDDQGQQFEGYLNVAANSGLLSKIEQRMQASPESAWQAINIAGGIARIEAATMEEFVPQTLNYDLTGHVNFKKGCYTGQEVVARLHYRGTPKRRTYLAELPQAASGAAGTALYSEEKSQSVGNIVNIASAGETILALVAATESGVEEGLHLDAPDGPLLTLAELPYSLSPG